MLQIGDCQPWTGREKEVAANDSHRVVRGGKKRLCREWLLRQGGNEISDIRNLPGVEGEAHHGHHHRVMPCRWALFQEKAVFLARSTTRNTVWGWGWHGMGLLLQLCIHSTVFCTEYELLDRGFVRLACRCVEIDLHCACAAAPLFVSCWRSVSRPSRHVATHQRGTDSSLSPTEGTFGDSSQSPGAAREAGDGKRETGENRRVGSSYARGPVEVCFLFLHLAAAGRSGAQFEPNSDQIRNEPGSCTALWTLDICHWPLGVGNGGFHPQERRTRERTRPRRGTGSPRQTRCHFQQPTHRKCQRLALAR